jgi:hypothetical protein
LPGPIEVGANGWALEFHPQGSLSWEGVCAIAGFGLVLTGDDPGLSRRRARTGPGLSRSGQGGIWYLMEIECGVGAKKGNRGSRTCAHAGGPSCRVGAREIANGGSAKTMVLT